MKIQGPNRGPKEAKTQSSRSGGPGGTEPTTVCPWRTPRTLVGGTHGRAPPGCWLFLRFRATVRFPSVFYYLAFYNAHVPGHSKHPIHSIVIPFHFLEFQSQFQREKEGAVKTCEDSIPASIERFKNAFWQNFSFPSPLFSQSNFMFCNFALILQLKIQILCKLQFDFPILC